MMRIVVVGLGSAAGGMCRYGVALFIERAGLVSANFFPAATWLVNVLGCLILSCVQEATLRGLGWSQEARLLLTTGFCGGFTTYSTFNFELATLAGRRGPLLPAVYFIATVGCCLAAHHLGRWLAAQVVFPGAR